MDIGRKVDIVDLMYYRPKLIESLGFLKKRLPFGSVCVMKSFPVPGIAFEQHDTQ